MRKLSSTTDFKSHWFLNFAAFPAKKKKVFNRIKYSLFKKDNKLQLLKRSLQDRSLKKESRINNMDLKKLKEKTVDINVGEILEEATKIFFERKKNMWLFLVT